MLRFSRGVLGKFCFLSLLFSLVANFTWAQSETATVSGQVVDPSGLNVTGAQVKLVDIDRDTSISATTSNSGLYMFPSVRPGRYRMAVTAAGFKVVNVTGLIVNVQDHIEQNFRLQVGSVAESVTVTAGAPLVNTTDATVSTVVDRQFAENLPLNGRSFQTLIQLTPGVVLAASTTFDGGQFNVNGQRANSNYWMVDGVSANIGVSSISSPGNGFAGAVGSFSVQGGTNSLVSVDALQEFRILTSTYAPEFGRTPGGQISIVTRSGVNQFHGTLSDYLRNDALDANGWFANNEGLSKPQERQNDFGGTFSGPILEDKTFFFFSYEGLRLRLPEVSETTVPDASFTPGGTTNSRQNAIPALQPYLNAFPLPNPNSPEILCDPATDFYCPPSGLSGSASFNASFSNRSTLDAYSLRIDHKLNDRLSLFGRYNYSPSRIVQRGQAALSVVSPEQITTQTATVGATWSISPTIVNDFRFNYSRTYATSYSFLDDFGGAVPLASLPFPSGFTSQNAYFSFQVNSLVGPINEGRAQRNLQRQINVVDGLSLQEGSHSVKFGVDFRRLAPVYDPPGYMQTAVFNDVPSAGAGNLLDAYLTSAIGAPVLFRNLGVFAQDTWRIIPSLTLTYGLRWDIDFAPTVTSGPNFAAVTNFNLNNLSNLALAPVGTPAFETPYGNVAPRIGVAYQARGSQGWETVLRGGFGIFFDLATQETGNTFQGSYPFGGINYGFGNFPLDPTTAAPPPITPGNLAPPFGVLAAFDPHLQLPYTLEWNIALQQSLGNQQTLSASYIGASGRRLIQTAYVYSPNANFGAADLVANAGSSDYDALQIQFDRRLLRGLQVLGSYTWSHSIDTGSAGSFGNGANTLIPTINANANRGPSDFDIRNAFSAGVTYDIPGINTNAFTKALLRGWSLQNIIQSRSAPPINVYEAILFYQLNNGLSNVRPDLVPGQALYLYGSGCADEFGPLGYPCAGGKGLNPAAFTSPPTDVNGNPLRQGNLGRNALRGFGATQWDFAIHRDFPIRESLKLQFLAEIFNALNHPNFGPPNGALGFVNFGVATETLGQSVSGANLGGGAFNPLYQIGGPRSIQLALKLQF